MGLHIHSLEGLNEEYQRDYYVNLLDYGWNEPISQALHENFDRMARISSEHKKSVVIARTSEGIHFNEEVLSWHNINGDDVEENGLLPAILITNKHPAIFRREALREIEKAKDELKLILIPLRKFCKTTTDVVAIINQIFADLVNNKDLNDFKIQKELKKGIGKAVADSLILEPNFYGVGFSFKNLKKYLKTK